MSQKTTKNKNLHAKTCIYTIQILKFYINFTVSDRREFNTSKTTDGGGNIKMHKYIPICIF